MTVSFEEATEIVRQQIGSSWANKEKPLYIPEWGSENYEWWQVPVGVKEYLVDFDNSWVSMDDTIYLVNKETGKFLEANYLFDMEIVKNLKPYGNVPNYFR